MKKSLRFTKMHGLGNDFVIINTLNQTVDLTHFPIQALANRHTGIGFDQLLVIEPGKKGDFFCRIFNADGSQAEQCGNGLRCVARFLHEENIHPQLTFSIETSAGIFPITIQDYDHISITMGTPHIEEKLIELSLASIPKLPVSIISTGNPHAIVKVEKIETIPANQLSLEIANHTFFPHGVNVGFMQIINPHHARLRTFERGAGETYACGSNACAAAVAGIINGWLQTQVTVEFRQGNLIIEWQGEPNQPLHMTGPATHVFSGICGLQRYNV